jgi:thyroid stimulating hormone receptor
MGFTWLRVSVWFVVVTAVVGNLAVLLVLLSNVLDLTVPKFLMCHLAFADLCMGVYLLILAVMDVHSSGVYFNFAYDWQIGKSLRPPMSYSSQCINSVKTVMLRLMV